jgi:hypothetical protein
MHAQGIPLEYPVSTVRVPRECPTPVGVVRAQRLHVGRGAVLRQKGVRARYPLQSVPLSVLSVPLPRKSVPLSVLSVPLSRKSVPLSVLSVPLPRKSVPLSVLSVPLPRKSVPLSVLLVVRDIRTVIAVPSDFRGRGRRLQSTDAVPGPGDMRA